MKNFFFRLILFPTAFLTQDLISPKGPEESSSYTYLLPFIASIIEGLHEIVPSKTTMKLFRMLNSTTALQIPQSSMIDCLIKPLKLVV